MVTCKLYWIIGGIAPNACETSGSNNSNLFLFAKFMELKTSMLMGGADAVSYTHLFLLVYPIRLYPYSVVV